MDDSDREHLHSLQIPIDAKTWNGRAAASIGRLYAIASGNAARVKSSLEREYWRGAAGVYDAIVTRYRAWEHLLHRDETRAYVAEHAKAERRKATACRDRSPNSEAKCHHDGRRDAWWRVYQIAYRQAWRARRNRKAGAK